MTEPILPSSEVKVEPDGQYPEKRPLSMAHWIEWLKREADAETKWPPGKVEMGMERLGDFLAMRWPILEATEDRRWRFEQGGRPALPRVKASDPPFETVPERRTVSLKIVDNVGVRWVDFIENGRDA